MKKNQLYVSIVTQSALYKPDTVEIYYKEMKRLETEIESIKEQMLKDYQNSLIEQINKVNWEETINEELSRIYRQYS